ncbi:MAG: hypothetical protein GY761_12230 [Hyphomicrobiales bacterium]|nr:hypothetical protein [Hyphomicrobiales bacterium]
MSMVAIAFFYGLFTAELRSCFALFGTTLAYIATIILAIICTEEITESLATSIAMQILAFNSGLLISIFSPELSSSKQNSA